MPPVAGAGAEGSRATKSLPYAFLLASNSWREIIAESPGLLHRSRTMAASADHNLLFGILALQMDFVTRDQLVAAMNAWVLDKAKLLGDILHEQGALNRDRQQLLESLVAEHLKQHNHDRQQSLAALSSVESVRQALEKITDPDVQASLASLAPVACSAAGGEEADQYSTVSMEDHAGHRARFRILRPHAAGGLGIVSVALDRELNREVAIKEIREQNGDNAEARARFLIEAQITGGLEHPGIVPVYSLGAYADGRPFYAMRFIKGDSLKEAINHFHRSPKARGESSGPACSVDFHSLPFRKLLSRFVDVCNAIAYAHSRGVLHRDLKPANIMLGRYGETLVVDWGLAKTGVRKQESEFNSQEPVAMESLLRPAAARGSSETLPGSALGTPAYMSPEQAAGRHDQLGPTSDVYSLGATLFCMLTGQAPFTDTDKGNLLQRVQVGTFARPRLVNPEVPRPLEAVCLKAMALNPAQRYTSPRELADDIDRWLADEPVSAWPEPVGVITGRWMRRHGPVLRGAVALLVVSLLVSLAVTMVIYRQEANLAWILSENVTSLEAAQDLEIHLRQLRFHSFLLIIDPNDQRRQLVETDHDGFERAMEMVRRNAHRPRERHLIAQIEENYQRYRAALAEGNAPATLRPDDLARWADAHPIRDLQKPCAELLQLSKAEIDETARESKQLSLRTRMATWLSPLLGLMSGLLAYYSGRFKRRKAVV
jgi:serine/threonine-protein kinase